MNVQDRQMTAPPNSGYRTFKPVSCCPESQNDHQRSYTGTDKKDGVGGRQKIAGAG
jgi:hypothetical protein